MTIQHISRLVLSFLSCTVLIGCGSTAIIQDVPIHLKQGKLYLAAKTIKVGGNQFNSEEGFIVVNENPSDTLSRRSMLPVLRIRSTNKNPSEPIFWLNGGPGHSNMKYRPLAALLENHDIVLVGYRGVDGSIILRSDEIEDAIEGDGSDLLGDKSLHTLSEALEQFSKNLKASNVDLAHYTIVDVISDLESVRNAFGYERINLLSISYGTRVALIYSYLHPGVVFRSVMIGVNPPGRFTWDPKKIDEQLAYYDSLFVVDSSHYDGRPLSQSMRIALAKMPSRWSLFKLDPGKIRAITFAMLYHKRSAALVFHCYRAAEEGDYSGLYALQRGYDFAFPGSLVWGDVFDEGVVDDSKFTYDPMDFDPPVNLPLWSKVLYPFVLLLSLF